MRKAILLINFICFLSLFLYSQNGINSSNNLNSSKYKKVISKESIPYTNKTEKQFVDTTNKLITIKGNPHPNQEKNITENNTSQPKTRISFENKQDNQIESYPDRPKFIDTGNYDLDIENYENAKTEWIKKHPEEYQEIKKTKKSSELKNEIF